MTLAEEKVLEVIKNCLTYIMDEDAVRIWCTRFSLRGRQRWQ